PRFSGRFSLPLGGLSSVRGASAMTKPESQSFYVRAPDFDYKDELPEVGPPRPVGKPVSDADHVKAYQNILFPTKEAAIQSWFDEIARFSEGSPEHVRSFVLNQWPAEDIVCKAEVEQDGGIWCFRRVAKL